jgi:hypothetical protein
MKITTQWLNKVEACSGGIDWVKQQKETDPIKLIQIALKAKKTTWNDEDILDYCNWGITRIFTKDECIRYAIYAAEKVIKIYEDRYPDDSRPRDAINAAKKYLKNPSDAAAYAASNAAYAASDAAVYATRAASDAAAYVARAAYAASYAAYASSYVASCAASDVASYAAKATNAADKSELKKQILRYGIKLLKKREKGIQEKEGVCVK